MLEGSSTTGSAGLGPCARLKKVFPDHWTFLLGDVPAHLMRVFVTGAYRKPREVTWLIGMTMFALAMIEGFLGYSPPDDQLSGTGIRIAQGDVIPKATARSARHRQESAVTRCVAGDGTCTWS